MCGEHACNFLRTMQSFSRQDSNQVVCEVPAAQQGDLESEGLEQRLCVFLMLRDWCFYYLAGCSLCYTIHLLDQRGSEKVRDQVPDSKTPSLGLTRQKVLTLERMGWKPYPFLGTTPTFHSL